MANILLQESPRVLLGMRSVCVDLRLSQTPKSTSWPGPQDTDICSFIHSYTAKMPWTGLQPVYKSHASRSLSRYSPLTHGEDRSPGIDLNEPNPGADRLQSMPISLVRMTELKQRPRTSSASDVAHLKHRSIVWFQESSLAAPCIVKRPFHPLKDGSSRPKRTDSPSSPRSLPRPFQKGFTSNLNSLAEFVEILKPPCSSTGHCLLKSDWFRFYSIYVRSHTRRLHAVVNA
ncbi:hypothetical protein KVR01_005691 [Diaporthe batatas]|uniref:uncharacterized protein n=1 Tax=Diaporthe batatas TaxID=748121 RepID=UPI001D041D96|nr:uncharacterized protein KVR01_005691 [Diaporthe batatas]KAG8165416.1 hypothetical protein KVR01_005691 [Diaporthe batatas]